MENLHHINLHIHLLSLHKKTRHKLNILRSTHLTCIYKNYTLHLKRPPKKHYLLPPPLDIFPKAQSPLLFSQNSASSKTERALFHTLTLCLSYSRDAAVPAVPTKTIKPFDPHCNWLVPGLHPDTASVARWQHRLCRQKWSHIAAVAEMLILDYGIWCPARRRPAEKGRRWSQLLITESIIIIPLGENNIQNLRPSFRISNLRLVVIVVSEGSDVVVEGRI